MHSFCTLLRMRHRNVRRDHNIRSIFFHTCDNIFFYNFLLLFHLPPALHSSSGWPPANPVHCLQTLHVFSLQILSASLPPPAITEENGMEYSVVLQSSPRNLFCDDMLFSPCLSDKRIFLRPPRRMDETHIRDDLFSYDRER